MAIVAAIGRVQRSNSIKRWGPITLSMRYGKAPVMVPVTGGPHVVVTVYSGMLVYSVNSILTNVVSSCVCGACGTLAWLEGGYQ